MRHHHKGGTSRAAEQPPTRSAVKRALAPVASGCLIWFRPVLQCRQLRFAAANDAVVPTGSPRVSFFCHARARHFGTAFLFWKPKMSLAKYWRRFMPRKRMFPRPKPQLGFSLPRDVSIPVPHSHTKEYLYHNGHMACHIITGMARFRYPGVPTSLYNWATTSTLWPVAPTGTGMAVPRCQPGSTGFGFWSEGG